MQGLTLEIGGGDNPKYRPNMDIRSGPTVDVVADLNDTFPIADDIYDNVYSAYLLEHISWRNVDKFVSEMFRVIKPGGSVLLITANLLQQCKTLVDKSDWTQSDVCMLFGDQNYSGDSWRNNAHYCGFSPKSVIELLTSKGFIDVVVQPHPNCVTDMIVSARKPSGVIMNRDPNTWLRSNREIAYGREYFDGGRGDFGGYAREGYWDYPVHWTIANKVLELKPSSVLELGPARGYILKRIEDNGVRVLGLEVSKHCIQTRVVEPIKNWDITETPWPIRDDSFDLCFSIAVLEHIPADKLPAIASEMKRTCRRGLHGISFTDDDFDKTHVTLKPRDWWSSILPQEQQIIDKEELAHGTILPSDDGKLKLNIGSFTTMFHHGWLNIDIHPLMGFANHHGYKFMQLDVRNGLSFGDHTVDMIYMCHFLEHLTYDEGRKLLSSCRRVLKPGGLIRIILPDAAKLINDYKIDGMDQFDDINDGCATNKLRIGKLWALLFAGHSSLYDGASMCDVLRSVGFTPYVMDFRISSNKQMLSETLDMFPTLSMYIEATV